MSDYKDKVTPGPWAVDLPGYSGDVRGPNGDVCVTVYRGMRTLEIGGAMPTIGASSRSEAEANAQLIAEAGTVLHETGMTPRELAEQRAELLAERDHARSCFDNAVKILTGIHSLLYPAPVKTDDGRKMVFRPKNPHEFMQALSDRIRAIPDEIAKIEAAQ